MSKINIQKISYDDAHPWVLRKHYARRIPNIKYAYGLFKDCVLVGVVTFGIPASPTLCRGVCGDEFSDRVLELNRLCIDSDIDNSASLLVANSMKLLPSETIVVSYADTSMGHVGYVYQATNFIYTGKTIPRTDPDAGDNVHHRHFGDDITTCPRRARAEKHRYIYFIGPKNWKKKMRNILRYGEQPYPKGTASRYDASYQPTTQMVLY